MKFSNAYQRVADRMVSGVVVRSLMYAEKVTCAFRVKIDFSSPIVISDAFFCVFAVVFYITCRTIILQSETG